MDDLKIIIDSLGEQNEEIEDDDLADIEEEIDSIDEEEYFELAKIAIKLGKPQILDYLVKIYSFDQDEIKKLWEEIQKFQRTQEKQAEDSDDEEDIEDIMEEYTKIIKNCRKLPYRKSTHKNTQNSHKF
jgi:GTPase involved in cell partitioning and DNA repair